MNVLEKILEEIEEHTIEFESFGMCDDYVSVGWVKEIIRSHMGEREAFKFDFNRVKSFECQCGRHYVNTYNDGWIPVEERLPERDYETVLCVDVDDYYFVAVYTKEDGFRTEDFGADYENIVACQPLPKPYKEEADENRG